MQKLWCVQHKNIKGLQEGYTWDIIKKYVLLLCEMVKLGEIKDMPKGLDVWGKKRVDHFQEIIMKYYGRFAAEITQIYWGFD